MTARPPRTLLVGLDGATWDLLDPAVGAGLLPNLGRFFARSLRGPLRSVDPPVTIPAWWSAMTGRSPKSLDAWGFTGPSETPGKMTWNSTYRPHDALWDLLGRRGLRVGVVNFPTLPAPPVHGYFVGGMLTPAGRATTFPTSLAGRLEKEFGPWHYDLPGAGRGRLPLALRTLEQKARLVEALEKEEPSDLLFVLLCETDRVQHDLYEDLERALKGKRDPEVEGYWRALDGTFQRIFEAFHRGTEGLTLVLSDHGFGPQTGELYTNRVLQRAGLLSVKPGAPSELRPRLKDLAAALDRFVALRRFFPPANSSEAGTGPPSALVEGAADGGPTDRTFGWYSQFIDWERTRAFSFPVPEGVYANTAHRALSPEERNALKREVAEAFRRVPGAQVELVDPEAIYGRPLGPQAPLLLLYAGGHAWETHGNFNHHRTHLTRRPSFFGRQGTHRPNGIVALVGPTVAPGTLAEPMPLLSVAPTLLALWGLEPPSPLDAPPHGPLVARSGTPPSP